MDWPLPTNILNMNKTWERVCVSGSKVIMRWKVSTPTCWTSAQIIILWCFCEKWGFSIGVMVLTLYKLYVLSPYTYPTPKLSPHRRRCIYTFPQKTHSVWFISVLNYGDTENVLINHFLLVIPVSLYKCMSSFVNNTHTHTHSLSLSLTQTHTLSLTHTHTFTYIYICTHTFFPLKYNYIIITPTKNADFHILSLKESVRKSLDLCEMDLNMVNCVN